MKIPSIFVPFRSILSWLYLALLSLALPLTTGFSQESAPAPVNPAPMPTSAPTLANSGGTTDSNSKTPKITTEPSHVLSPEQQQEIARKQANLLAATRSLDQAKTDEDKKQYAEARKVYLAALTEITPSNSTQAVYDRAVQGLLRVNAILINEARAKGDPETIGDLLQNSLAYEPKNEELLKQYAHLKKAEKDPTDTEYLGNPAIKPTFLSKVDRVQKLFTEAEQYEKTGRFDDAEQTYKKILSLDPYNNDATKGLAKIYKEEQAYAEVARQQTRDQRIREVDAEWAKQFRSENETEIPLVTEEPITRSNEFAINQKLKSIVLPTVDFDNSTLQEAIAYLAFQSQNLDLPSKEGINFIPRDDVYSTAPKISLHLRNIPLGEALRYVVMKAGVKYKVDPNGIFILKQGDITEALVSRTFRVNANFLASSAPSQPTGPSRIGGPATDEAIQPTISTDSVVTDVLKEKGVNFDAPGSQAYYLAGPGELHVTNTQDQMDLLEELVNAESTPTKMVEVQIKLVEINQEDMNDITSNITYNMFGPLENVLAYTKDFTSYLPVPQGTFGGLTGGADPTGAQFNSELRGSSAFNTNTLSTLENSSSTYTSSTNPNYQNSPITHRFEIGGVLDGRTFTMLLTALAAKQSTDLLSSPTVRGNAGTTLDINLTQGFYYPSAFSPPQSVVITTQNLNGGGGGGITVITLQPPAVIPAFPTEFSHEDLGVHLKVTPNVGSDNRSIGMHLNPSFSEFEGFINYGTPITIPDSTNTPQLLSNNQIPQPVFNRRLVDTTVTVRDGYTVVLGGFIREDVETVNDKVPILGDIPMVGRLFQSKADKHTKKNLLMFVTARILGPDGELFNSTPAANVATSGE